MTYLEKYKQDHPDATYTICGLPVDCDCPFNCGYEDVVFEGACPYEFDCNLCWRR